MGKGNILAPLERIENIENNIKDVAIPLMKDNWVLDNTTSTYKQTVAIEGLKADSNPIIVLSTVDEEATDAELDAFSCLEDETTIGDGSITFVASEIPVISFTVIAKGVMAGEGTAIADITTLVGKVNELETKIDELNSDIEWKFLQQEIGGVNVMLPTDYKEILVEATRPRENLNDVKYTFRFYKDQLLATEEFYRSGMYASTTNYETVSILTTYKYLRLYGWNDSGTEVATDCYIKTWYR